MHQDYKNVGICGVIFGDSIGIQMMVLANNQRIKDFKKKKSVNLYTSMH